MKKSNRFNERKKELKNNEVNDLLGNYNKLYEIYKLINEDKIINDINKKEYLIEKKFKWFK